MVVLSITKIRETKNNILKTGIYIVLGLFAFALVGMAYNMWQPVNVTVASELLQPYVQFYPIFVLSIIFTAVTLVTYMDREKYGHIFAGMGFAVVLPDLITYISNSRYDLLLLDFAIWTIIMTVWVRMWKDIIYEPSTIKEKGITALKACIVTYPLYLITSIVSVLGESPNGFNMNAIVNVVSGLPDVLKYILSTLWLYVLIVTIIVTVMFILHDLALHTFNIRRVITSKNEIEYFKEVEEIPKPKVEAPKFDAYKSLIDEMQIFQKYMDQIDRIKAASTIARFKSEYQTIAARYNDGSKSEAEVLIRSLDQEFKAKY
jgi:hypothetical protein